VSARAVLLVGSAKPTGTSTSEALGTYLMGRLADRGVVTAIRFVNRSARRDHIAPLLHDLDHADLLVLASPVYVDALPYLVTRALERIADHRARPGPRRETRFAAILNCGFPEVGHCDTAHGICRSFARHAALDWAGALAMGAGGVMGGRPLDAAGGMARHARAALELAAEALADGQPVPRRAAALMARPLVPGRLYTALAHLDWLRQARRNGVLTRLGDRPFA
jgi:multimeric flavodoxin WrbA